MTPASRPTSNGSAGVPETALQQAGRIADAFDHDQALAERQAGWTEEQARVADVRALAAGGAR